MSAKHEVCKKCGAAIKNVYEFEGGLYGADCVLIVAGLNKWELRTSGKNVDSYISRKKVRVEQQKSAIEKAELKKAALTLENGWLIDYLEANQSGFARSMANALKEKSYKELSENQKNALLNLWIQPYKGIQEGYAMFEFIGATEGFEPEEHIQAQQAIATYATVSELKAILKENSVKGYSKLNRDELEEEASAFIEI